MTDEQFEWFQIVGGMCADGLKFEEAMRFCRKEWVGGREGNEMQKESRIRAALWGLTVVLDNLGI